MRVGYPTLPPRGKLSSYRWPPLFAPAFFVTTSSQEIRRKSAERSREDKSRLASNHAAQRQNQNVRKPWVAHISAELDTANQEAQKVAGVAATAAKETAAAATAAAATVSAAVAVPQGAAPAATLGTASVAPGTQAPGLAVASPAVIPAAAAGVGGATGGVQGTAAAAVAAAAGLAATGVQIATPVQVAVGGGALDVGVGAGDRSEPVEIDLVG